MHLCCNYPQAPSGSSHENLGRRNPPNPEYRRRNRSLHLAGPRGDHASWKGVGCSRRGPLAACTCPRLKRPRVRAVATTDFRYRKGLPTPLTALRLRPKSTPQQLPTQRRFPNILLLTGITVDSMVCPVMKDSAYLHVSGLVAQSIEAVRVSVDQRKENITKRKLRTGKRPLSPPAHVKGSSKYRFLARFIDDVLPRIRDWKSCWWHWGCKWEYQV